jgi:hypothetical protein
MSKSTRQNVYFTAAPGKIQAIDLLYKHSKK